MPVSDAAVTLAAQQAGVLSRQQALSAGLSEESVRALLLNGRWQRLHGGVYATFTGDPSRLAELWAAVLRAGRAAVLSHHSAGELQGLLDERSRPIHVSVPADRRIKAGAGLVVHVSTRLPRAAHPSRRPPQTRLEETVADLVAEAATLDEAMGWLTRAVQRRLTTHERLAATLADRGRLRWRSELADALTDLHVGAHSRLELRDLTRVERAHRLPTGRRQARRSRPGGWYYDDVRYDEHRVHVELDGALAHSLDTRFRDLRRDNAAVLAGAVVLRYGWSDVTQRPCAVAAQVGRVLRRQGWFSSPAPCGRGCELKEGLLG